MTKYEVNLSISCSTNSYLLGFEPEKTLIMSWKRRCISKSAHAHYWWCALLEWFAFLSKNLRRWLFYASILRYGF